MRGKYDDIINIEYPYPSKHEKMSMYERAAQFSPFAALTGYEELIEEEARYVEGKTELSETEKEEINDALTLLLSNPTLSFTITYFSPDKIKTNGGKYIKIEKTKAKKIVEEKHFLILSDGSQVPFEDIIRMEIPEK